MKSDVRGRSTCQTGCESHDAFYAGGRRFYQYDYRDTDGRLFSCVAKSLEDARAKRDKWASKKLGG